MANNKSLKNICFLMAVFILSINTVSGAISSLTSSTGTFSANEGSYLKVSILKYEPVPADIGKYVDVWVKVENSGSGKTDDLSIELAPEYPLSLDSKSNALVNIGILGPESAAVHEYRLYVDNNAKVGNASFDILYQSKKDGAWFKETFDLQVGSITSDSKGNIELDGIPIMDPQVFMPGDKGTIAIVLKNSATSYSVTVGGETFDTNARVQSATLTGTDGITVTTNSYTGNGVLGPGESLPLTYNIEIADNVSDGTYFLDFSIIGNSYSFNNNWRIPVRVDSSSVRIIPSKPLKLENGKGTLQFDVANIRPNPISAVSVKLMADGVEFSPSEYFIGSMGADELYTIEVDAEDISGNLTSPRQLTLTANFRNGMNSHEDIVATHPVALVTIKQGSNTSTIVLLLLVLILAPAAYIMYRRRKKV
ncbi:COG1361 S-layer family protein [uncultured Methanomethylovorans sp.]|uniref:COG1361 S-layer family protein n=1 Tax=uncultured Methanomethylovorans sp. TaxID=183759 RepID=UPI002AA6FCDC|nr:COG1361 S-layer family protein [uncultured Methanomethylovorans sp.]